MSKSKRLKKPTADLLITEVNAWCESVEEYLSDESSPLAEYCSDFGYGEGQPDLKNLDEHCKRLVKSLYARVKDKKRRLELLASCSNVTLTGIYNLDNEIFSVSMGECEEQMPDELYERLKLLSDEDYSRVRNRVNCYIPERGNSCANFGYFNREYDRWVLILNVDELYRTLQDIPSVPEEEEENPKAIRLETHTERRAVFKLILGGAS